MESLTDSFPSSLTTEAAIPLPNSEELAAPQTKQDPHSPVLTEAAEELPEVTHLQFLVLDAVDRGQAFSRQIRDVLKAYGQGEKHPAFYMLLRRMEEAGLLEGSRHSQVVELTGRMQHLREKVYRLTEKGAQQHRSCLAFYQHRLNSADSDSTRLEPTQLESTQLETSEV